jgi:hypothetical protein
MTKDTRHKMKLICTNILTKVLEVAANNLVMEAAVFANSTGFMGDSIGHSPESERLREKELDIFIKSINGQLSHARAQAIIYIDNLVLDNEE